MAYSFIERYSSLGIQFLSTIIIARLLSPQDIGIYSVGAGVIAIAHAFRDFGVSAYLIQEPELTQDRQRAAFTVTLTIAWVIALAIFMGAKTIASFYGDERVHEVLVVLAINFFLIPFGSVTLALLRRDMAFDVIFRINIISALVHSGVGVTLAMLGYGFMSLAWAAFAGTAAMIVAAFIVRPAAVILMPSVKEIHRVLGFGGKMSLSSVAIEAGNSAPDLIIGRALGFEAVGYFSRAIGFIMLFDRIVLDGLRGVLLPYFSNESRAGLDLSEKIKAATGNLLAVAWPALGFLGILAEPLITILYGKQWGDSIPLAQMIAVGYAVRCLGPVLSSALVAKGYVNYTMFIAMVSVVLRVIALMIGVSIGLFAAAFALVVADTVTAMLLVFVTSRVGLFTIPTYFRVMIASLPLVAVTLMLPLFAVTLVEVDNGIISAVMSVAAIALATFLIWLVMIWMLKHPLQAEIVRFRRRIPIIGGWWP